ncbi:hypothetical protein GN958_ATG00731 [Phytophthora infestans]|uniref:Uncharacterized protein n=1 Tax=Phytophthora infestans TaxID=4787 RepID=A0A8S9VAS5_PHYIN|nr:hypothetical protein GN958_ATG00731 [Phytophthora infestans]
MVSCRFAEHSRQKEHAVSFSVCRFSASQIHGVVCWLLFVSMVLSIDEQRERNRMAVRRHRSHETDDARKERVSSRSKMLSIAPAAQNARATQKMTGCSLGPAGAPC